MKEKLSTTIPAKVLVERAKAFFDAIGGEPAPDLNVPLTIEQYIILGDSSLIFGPGKGGICKFGDIAVQMRSECKEDEGHGFANFTIYDISPEMGERARQITRVSYITHSELGTFSIISVGADDRDEPKPRFYSIERYLVTVNPMIQFVTKFSKAIEKGIIEKPDLG